MPVSLDLHKAHKVRRHGDLLAIYTWVNDERALLLLHALHKNAAWFVVCKSAAFCYDDVSVLAAQCIKACEVLGVKPSQRNWVRIAAIIHEGLDDIVCMPSAPTPELGPRLSKVQLREDLIGRLYGFEDFRPTEWGKELTSHQPGSPSMIEIKCI